MPDEATSPPPSALATVPVPGSFQQAANVALAGARSPLEAASDAAARQPQQAPPEYDAGKALAAARQKDLNAGNAAQQRGEPPAAPATPAATPADPAAKPSLEWKPKPKGQQVREIIEKHTSREQELLGQIESLKHNSVTDVTKHPDFAKLKAERDEFYEIVKGVAVERDPEFKARFDTKRDSAINAAKFAAGGAADKLGKLLQQPPSAIRDSAIEDMTKDFTDSAKRRINAALTTLDQIDIERDAEIASRRANFEQRQLESLQSRDRASEERQRKLDLAYERVKKQWQDPEEGHPFFQKRQGDEAWNKQVDQSLELADLAYKGDLDPAQLATMALWAAAGPRALEVAQTALAERDQYKAAYARLKGVQPGQLGSVSLPASDGKSLPTDPRSPEYINHFISGLEEARRADGLGR